MFVTPPSEVSLSYLLKNYMLFQSCDVDCAVKYKIYHVFFLNLEIDIVNL